MASTRRPPHPSPPSAPAGPATPSDATGGCNLAILWGQCSAGVEVRTLASGRRLATFAVRTPASAPPRRRPGGAESATSVPVTVWDPPAWLDAIGPDDPVVVIGTVRRRFFSTRSGSRAASVEVEAVTVARGTPGQRKRAWQRAAEVLGALG